MLTGMATSVDGRAGAVGISPHAAVQSSFWLEQGEGTGLVCVCIGHVSASSKSMNGQPVDR
jgi:hypothetical protein